MAAAFLAWAPGSSAAGRRRAGGGGASRPEEEEEAEEEAEEEKEEGGGAAELAAVPRWRRGRESLDRGGREEERGASLGPRLMRATRLRCHVKSFMVFLSFFSTQFERGGAREHARTGALESLDLQSLFLFLENGCLLIHKKEKNESKQESFKGAHLSKGKVLALPPLARLSGRTEGLEAAYPQKEGRASP